MTIKVAFEAVLITIVHSEDTYDSQIGARA